jgi:hypothetical protein
MPQLVQARAEMVLLMRPDRRCCAGCGRSARSAAALAGVMMMLPMMVARRVESCVCHLLDVDGPMNRQKFFLK